MIKMYAPVSRNKSIHSTNRIFRFSDKISVPLKRDSISKILFYGTCFCNASTINVILLINNFTEIANRIIPKNLRMI